MAKSQTDPPGRRKVPVSLILVGLAAALVVLAVYFWRAADRPPTTTDVVETGPTLAETVLKEAEYRMKRGEYRAARQIMWEYVRNRPGEVEVRPLLAEACWHIGKHVEAERAVDAVMKQGVFSARLLWLKGKLVRRRGGSNPIFYFRKAAKRTDATDEIRAEYAIEALAGEDAAERAAGEDLLKEIAAGDELPPKLWAALGQRLKQRGLDGLGEVYLQRGSKPRDPKVLAEAGLSLLAAGIENWGRTYLEQARAAGIKDAQVFLLWGQVELKNGHPDRAKNLLNEARARDSGIPRVWLLQGLIEEKTGRLPEAEAVLRRGIDRCRGKGGLAQLWMALGRVCQARNDLVEAVKAYDAAALDRSQRAAALLSAARCLYRVGRYGEALDRIDRAAELGGSEPEIEALRRSIEDARFVEPG